MTASVMRRVYTTNDADQADIQYIVPKSGLFPPPKDIDR
jgi:hypothetical protein